MNLRTIVLTGLLVSACTENEPDQASAPDAAERQADAGKTAGEKPEAAPVDLSPPADVAAPPADATTTETGLAYKVLTEGDGDAPGAADVVEVHYTGWTTDGESFDSSYKRNKPAKFPLNKVIAGWTEGLQLMVAGEKTRFWIPVDLAYKNRPGKPAGMLVFDVELLEIID